MRKLTIPNYETPSSRPFTDITSLIGTCLFRVDSKGKSFNKAASKLNFPQSTNPRATSTNGWISERGHTVIIKDERQEVALMGSRSLITSGLMLEECLQINRVTGFWSPKGDNFFVLPDKVRPGTHQDVHYKLPFLDLLWYMDEQDIDALDIEANPSLGQRPHGGGTFVTSGEGGYMSKRYKNIIEGGIKKLIDTATPYLTECWEMYEKDLKAQDGETINWDTSFRSREWGKNSPFVRRRYSFDDNVMSQYYEYCHQMSQRKPRSFEKWYRDENRREAKDWSVAAQNVMLLMHFGFADPCLTEQSGANAASSVESKQIAHTKKLIAKTKFKRGDDWSCDIDNLVRAEALKLRIALNGGTFIE